MHEGQQLSLPNEATLPAQSNLSKHMDDRIWGAFSQLQGEGKIWILWGWQWCCTWQTWEEQQHGHDPSCKPLKVLLCQPVSSSGPDVYLCSSSYDKLKDTVVLVLNECVSLQVTLLTKSTRRLTSFPQVDYSLPVQVHDDLLSRLQCQSTFKCVGCLYQWIHHWNVHESEIDVGFHCGKKHHEE